MPNRVVNYDGSVAFSPQQIVCPASAADIQAVMRDPVKYPAPVRAMGSYHSLTACASTDGTIVNMTQLAQAYGQR
jgi:FAD/FMN-containing dehydrogenase